MKKHNIAKLFLSLITIFTIYSSINCMEPMQLDTCNSDTDTDIEIQSDTDANRKKKNNSKKHKRRKRKKSIRSRGKKRGRECLEQQEKIDRKNKRQKIDTFSDTFLYQISEKVFQNYKEYSIKNRNENLSSINPIITIKKADQIINKFINLFAQENDFTNPKSWIDKKSPKQELIRNIKDKLNFRHPYAQVINIKSNTEIVTFGDIHGSAHSLLRSLWRLVLKGFLTADLKIIDPNNQMIFLGDYIDRGRWGLETLLILCQLKLQNPNNIFLLRGNHEDPKMGCYQTIRKEIREKFSKTPDLAQNLIAKLNCFYDLLPFVLYTKCNNNIVSYSHAGFDPSYNPTNLLKSKTAKYECLLDKKEITPFLDQATRNRALKHFREYEQMPVGDETKFYCTGFTWMDFARYKNEKEIIYNPNKLIYSGHGYVCSLECTQKYINWLNKQLSKHGLVFKGFVRGHQHTSSGLMMFDPKADVEKGQSRNWTSIVNTEYLSNPEGFNISKYFPLYTLLSAPEGVGNDDAHGITVKFNHDSFCAIKTADKWESWKMKPFEQQINNRDVNGSFCSLYFGNKMEPIDMSFDKHRDSFLPINFANIKIPNTSTLFKPEYNQDQFDNIYKTIRFNLNKPKLDLNKSSENLNKSAQNSNNSKKNNSYLGYINPLGIFRDCKNFLYQIFSSSHPSNKKQFTLRQQNNPDIKLEKKPLDFPITPDRKTQSYTHIRYLLAYHYKLYLLKCLLNDLQSSKIDKNFFNQIINDLTRDPSSAEFKEAIKKLKKLYPKNQTPLVTKKDLRDFWEKLFLLLFNFSVNILNEIIENIQNSLSDEDLNTNITEEDLFNIIKLHQNEENDDTDTNEYLNIVKNMLAQEEIHKDYFAFYHSHYGDLTFLHNVLHMLHLYGLMEQDAPLPLRAISKEEFYSNLSTFLDQTKYIVKDYQGRYTYTDENNNQKRTFWFDHIPHIGQQLLSVNISLFGNAKRRGESSFLYFLRNHSEHKFDLSSLIEKIFKKLNIPQPFIDKIINLKKEIYSEQNSKFLQILIKRDIVNEIAYYAFPGGKPVNKLIIAEAWNQNKKYHDNLYNILNLQINEPKKLNSKLVKYKYKGTTHEYKFNLDKTQARLWLPSQHLYNPIYTKVFRYGIENNVQEKLNSELVKIFKEITKNLIQKKLLNKQEYVQTKKNPLEQINTIIEKLQNNIKYEKYIKQLEYLNLEIGNKKTSSFANRFLIACKKYKNHKKSISLEDANDLLATTKLIKKSNLKRAFSTAIEFKALPVLNLLISRISRNTKKDIILKSNINRMLKKLNSFDFQDAIAIFKILSKKIQSLYDTNIFELFINKFDLIDNRTKKIISKTALKNLATLNQDSKIILFKHLINKVHMFRKNSQTMIQQTILKNIKLLNNNHSFKDDILLNFLKEIDFNNNKTKNLIIRHLLPMTQKFNSNLKQWYSCKYITENLEHFTEQEQSKIIKHMTDNHLIEKFPKLATNCSNCIKKQTNPNQEIVSNLLPQTSWKDWISLKYNQIKNKFL